MTEQPVALTELLKQQANIGFMFRAFADEFAKSVASGRSEDWLNAVRAYIRLVESSCPIVECRKATHNSSSCDIGIPISEQHQAVTGATHGD